MTPIPVNTDQLERLRAYASALRSVNRNVALLSRGEMDFLWERHVMHSLVLAIRAVPAGATVADWGTGGGLPAIPLSIVWPNATLFAIDSNAKKTRSVAHFCRTLAIDNCHAVHVRAEAFSQDIHYSVSRATAPLAVLWAWHRACVVPLPGHTLVQDPSVWSQGLLCLKGGDLTQEIASLTDTFPKLELTRFPVSDYLDDPYFSGKEIIHVQEPHGPTG